MVGVNAAPVPFITFDCLNEKVRRGVGEVQLSRGNCNRIPERAAWSKTVFDNRFGILLIVFWFYFS